MAPTFIDGGDAHRLRDARAAQPRRPGAGVVARRVAASGSCPRSSTTSSTRPSRPTGATSPIRRTSTSPQSVLVIRDRREQREAIFRPGTRGRPSGIPASRPTARAWSSASPTSAASRIASVDLKGQGLTILAPSAGISGWPAVLARRPADRLRLQPGRRPRALRDGRRRRPAFAPDPQPRPRPAPRLVARRQADRVHEQPATATRRSTSSTRTGRTRGTSPATPAATPTRPGTPTAVGSPSSPIAAASRTST